MSYNALPDPAVTKQQGAELKGTRDALQEKIL
eukprot:CAMPEP_0195052758 /NCGR_PEP_ID=MMETSP0448-20130528/2057_1 /TAXON_ID=66468 /ORGANISM="Heterocapsa triquestra, Strain CCMP 448" /LENGTH=31 /DNA_ID= /DNA_START= /DNA_END= /DNA_ORIENTATION=